MEEELPFMNLWDGDFPSPCHSFERPTGPPTLPPTLRRAGSEPTLPTFMIAKDYSRQELDNAKNSKTSSRSSAPDLCKLLDVSWPWNSGPQFSPVPAHNINKDSEDTESTSSSGDSDTSEDSLSFLEDTKSYYNSAPHEAEEAETEDTGSDTMLSVISLDWLWIHEDNSGIGMPGPEADTEVTASKETDVQCTKETLDTINLLEFQSENPEYEIIYEITLQESPPISSKDQPQEVATVSKKKHRRGWKGVRRRISHLFSSLCCCLLTPEIEVTVPRKERTPMSLFHEDAPESETCASMNT